MPPFSLAPGSAYLEALQYFCHLEGGENRICSAKCHFTHFHPHGGLQGCACRGGARPALPLPDTHFLFSGSIPQNLTVAKG